VFIKFDVQYRDELEDIKQQVQAWAERHGIRYTQKTIKYHHRIGFNQPEHFTLFALTWNHDLHEKPYLKPTLVTVQNEKI